VIELLTAGLGGIASAVGASKQQSASKEMAREQMRFQERMSSTAYQRAAKDLEKAGLNRIIALGSPASSPGGAMGQAQNIMGQGVSSALQTAQATANVKLTNEQARKVGYEADKLKPVAAFAGAGGDVAEGIVGHGPAFMQNSAKIIRSKMSDFREGASEYLQNARDTRDLFMQQLGNSAKSGPKGGSAHNRIDEIHRSMGFNNLEAARQRVIDQAKKMDFDSSKMTDEQILQWVLDHPDRVAAFSKRRRESR